MADRLRFHSLVPGDLLAAIAWYDRISPELGNRFRSLVDDRFDAIEADPEQFSRLFEDCFFTRIPRFPYFVLFQVHESTVWVLGLFHIASDPAKWDRRTI